MSNSPSFFLSAKNKATGEQVDIGTIFASKNGNGFNMLVKPGTVIKVTHKYDRETRQVVELPKPIYVDGDNFYINMNENKVRTDKGDGVETQVRESFDLPF